jgi:hypothetical protein
LRGEPQYSFSPFLLLLIQKERAATSGDKRTLSFSEMEKGHKDHKRTKKERKK